VITPALFLATKLEAFKDRGKGDCYASHDLEDIVTLVDGRTAIVEDVSFAPSDVRSFIANGFAKMLDAPDFHDALPGHLPAMAGARQRAPLVIDRITAIAALA